MLTTEQRQTYYRAPFSDGEIARNLEHRVPLGRRVDVAPGMLTYEPSLAERWDDLQVATGRFLASPLGIWVARGAAFYGAFMLVVAAVNAVAKARGL